MGQTAANLPFQQQVAPVESFSDDQLSAFANMRNLQGAAQPYFGVAANMMGQSANPLTGGEIGNYMNPFADFMLGGMRDLFGQQMSQTTGNLTHAAGGPGADRIGVAQSNLAKQQANAYGTALSNQWANSVAAAQQDKARQQAAGYGFAAMGPAAQAALMSGTQGLYGMGAQQQQLAQAQRNAPYQWDLARIQHQYQMPQFLSGLTAQTAPALGGTQTTTYPQQSMLGQIAGLGMTALGAYNGGLFGGLGSLFGGGGGGAYGTQPGQYNPNVPGGWNPYYGGFGGSMYGARGGAVNGRSQGGGVMPDMAGMGFQGGGEVPYAGINPFAPPMEDETTPQGNLYNPASWENQITVPPGSFPLPQAGPGSFGDRFAGIADSPQPIGPVDPREGSGYQEAINRALESGDPLPPDPRIAPQTAPAPQQQDEEIPIGAQPAQGPVASPRMPPLQPVRQSQISIPPDTGQGNFARNPWLAMMQAGLATMSVGRDSRGLPLSPLAAIGKGGMEGLGVLREQDKEATARRRVEFEAARLQMAAEEARRQAESHPLELQQKQIANQAAAQGMTQRGELHPYAIAEKQREDAVANLALQALRSTDRAMRSPKFLNEMGLTIEQANALGPAGVQAHLKTVAGSRYDFKTIDGRMFAIRKNPPDGTLRPERDVIEIGGGGEGRFAVEYNPPRGAAGAATAPVAAPAARPGQPTAAGRPAPSAVPTGGDPSLAYGPPGVILNLSAAAQGMWSGRNTPHVEEQKEVRSRLQLLTERLAQVVARGDNRQLQQQYKNIDQMIPKVGKLWTSWPEARSFLNAADDEMESRINKNRIILNNPAFRTEQPKAALENQELTRLQREIRQFTGQGQGQQRQQEQKPPPPQALQSLKEGVNTTFGNGEVWTLRGGQPVRVR